MYLISPYSCPFYKPTEIITRFQKLVKMPLGGDLIVESIVSRRRAFLLPSWRAIGILLIGRYISHFCHSQPPTHPDREGWMKEGLSPLSLPAAHSNVSISIAVTRSRKFVEGKRFHRDISDFFQLKGGKGLTTSADPISGEHY